MAPSSNSNSKSKRLAREEEPDNMGVANKCPQGRKRKHEDPEQNEDQKGVAIIEETPAAGEEWDEETHKLFAEAIYDIGLRNSSPAVILENMVHQPKMITSERVKSKLQKYRNHREKSKQEFMEEYDSFIRKAKAIETSGGGGSATPGAMLEMMGSSDLFGGDAAAFLSYAVMKEREIKQGGGSVLSTSMLKKGALEYVDNFSGSGITFPTLTEEEKQSSLGVSMTFIMGLFLSMTQHIMKERARAEGQAGAFPPDESSPVPQFASAPQVLPNEVYDMAGHQMGGKQPATTTPFSLDQAAQQYVRPPGQQLMPMLPPGAVQSGQNTGGKRGNDAGNPTQSEMV
jgi:SHAQKYF class myb-like DNA-binding protein